MGLFTGSIKPNNKQAPKVNLTLKVNEQGNIVFPSQEETYAKLRHVLSVFSESNADIRPHFHMTGPSGSGKSFLLKMVAEELGLPFMEVNAAGLTSEGLSGNSLSKALRKLREHWNEPNIIFVDEFDKLFQRNGETTEGFRSAVQDEFLTSLESKYTSVFTDYGKYEPVVIENSLFVFGGAYSNQNISTMPQLKDAGLRIEFIGRVPLIIQTKDVSVHELEAALPSVKLFLAYRKMFNKNSVSRDVQAISKIIQEQNRELNIGIRLLNSAIHQHFMGKQA